MLRLKDVATRCVLRAVNASKCVCSRGSAPDPTGGAYSAPPDPLAVFWGRERSGEGWRGKGLGSEREREKEGREKGEGEGRGRSNPLWAKILATALLRHLIPICMSYFAVL